MVNRVCLIVGAGCTVSDVNKRPKRHRPPLDKGFFDISKITNPTETGEIHKYIHDNYGISIFREENDSLENVMTKIYTDMFDPNLTEEANEAFRLLIRLFNSRLAYTTNNIPASQKRHIYRLIHYFLSNNVSPENITIITFNQDLQIEKNIYKLSQAKKWKNKYDNLFNFPHCYHLDVRLDNVTGPRDNSALLFDKSGGGTSGISILKLHGSLNWYSTLRSLADIHKAIFKQNRVIRITRRQTINPYMSYVGGSRSQHTFPVIIPPVNQKSSVMHQNIQPIWAKAEEDLRLSDTVIIFGYSCPPLDFESSNMIQRSLRGNTSGKNISVIDPDPNIVKHYIDLVEPRKIVYYPSAQEFHN